MIKGVNRQVVEVGAPECEYFERILFFVRPEFAAVSDGKLQSRARRMACETGAPPPSKRKLSRLRKFLGLAVAAAAGAGLSCAILLLLN
jgi:hypothetical protein